MDPQHHPHLHFLVRIKKTPTNVFLQVAKNVQFRRGKMWAVRWMLNCFPAWAYPSPNWKYGDGCFNAKERFHPTAFQSILTIWRVAALPATKKENYTSLLFSACLHLQCWTNTFYTTFTSRAIDKLMCGPVHFHNACLLLYRWHYRCVTIVLPASKKNVFYGWCSFPILTAPYMSQW